MQQTRLHVGLVLVNGGEQSDRLDIQGGYNETEIRLAPHETVVMSTREPIDVLSVMPRRIMGTQSDPHLKWGKDGDDCVICLEEMTSEHEVSDLPPCNHTYISLDFP
jgi:hypothetical protein